MEKKRVVPVWVSVVLLVLCAVAMVLNIIGLSKNGSNTSRIIGFILEVIDIALATCYCLTGYKKSAAVFFKAVVFARLVACFIYLMYMFTSQQIIPFICALIPAFCLSVFAVANNLGKTRSLIMAVIMIISPIVQYVWFIATGAVQGLSGTFVTSLILSVIFLIMVYAKYKDKEARGTK